MQQPTQQNNEKIEIDVDQVLFEIVKDMNLDVYSFYKIRNMFYRMLRLSEDDRKELFKELERLKEDSQ